MISCGTALRGVAHQAWDIQNQRHATVPENGRAGDAFDAPIVRLHRLDHHLLLAGDTLFAGSIGRTDLPGGSMQKIIRSLHDTVLALPDETVVVPGHGDLTTIGEERESNPFLVKR